MMAFTPADKALIHAARTDPAARERALAKYRPLALALARRYSQGFDDFDDLVQEGVLGLDKAIRLYAPDQAVQFPTYAHHLILGAIRHFLRDKCSTIRHPAWIQEERCTLTRIQDRFYAIHRRSPTRTELAELAGKTEEQIHAILATKTTIFVDSYDVPPASADEPTRRDEEVLWPTQTPAGPSTVELLYLSDAFHTLNGRQSEFVRLKYERGWTQTEIAQRCGVSSNYVSRILHQAIRKLRDYYLLEDLLDHAPTEENRPWDVLTERDKALAKTRLSDAERELMSMHVFGELHPIQIAKKTGIPAQDVKATLRSARRKIDAYYQLL